MGIVYEAEDTQLQRRVAVKLLPAELSSNAESLARFLREARAAARLNHGNVVPVYDIGESAGVHYIVMELMTGGSAAEIVRSCGSFPWREATAILRDVCRGVAAAHKAGMIHRDIKPANILRSVEGIVKLGDFGLAKPAGIQGTGLTGLGEVVGTPHFMSPEQSRCDKLDERSDLYSLGATYFALLTGHPPFDSPDGMQVLFAHCSQPVPDPRTVVPAIPAECVKIVHRAMEKSRAEQYRNAGEMLGALERILAGGFTEPSTAAGATLPKSLWETAKPALSLAGVSAVERSRKSVLKRRSWSWGLTTLGIFALAASAVFLSLTRPITKPTPQKTIASSTSDDWPKLSAEMDRAIRLRDVRMMRDVADRFEIHQRRNVELDASSQDAIRVGRLRLDKAIAFRESITEKGLVIGMEGRVSSVAFSPNDDWLAFGQTEGTFGAIVLDGHTGEKRSVLWTGKGNPAVRVQSLAFDRTSSTLTAAGTTTV